MADYLIQPDSGGTCCDCPTRTGPCDACLGPCQTPIHIKFTGVKFDCGCTAFTPALASSWNITDGSAVNTFNGSFDLALIAGCTTDCPAGGSSGDWEIRHLAQDLYTVVYDFWSDSGNCSTIASPGNTLNAFPVLNKISGTYYLFAFIQSTDTLIFYGTSTSISLPFANTLACNSSYVNFSNPGINCKYGGGGHSFNVIAHGGTAQVSA